MVILRVIITACSFPFLVSGDQDYNPYKYHLFHFNQSTHAVDRMIVAMKTYIEDGIIRVQDLNLIRWLYEGTMHYEAGYIMGDIIERYKKMVEEVTRAHINSDYQHLYYENDFLQLLMKLEIIQKLYFEIYHLVRMFHEIPKKFKYEIVTYAPDLAQIKYVKEQKEAAKQIQIMQQKREERKAAQKKKKKQQLEDQAEGITTEAAVTGGGSNLWWPIDYGWEVDAYGW